MADNKMDAEVNLTVKADTTQVDAAVKSTQALNDAQQKQNAFMKQREAALKAILELTEKEAKAFLKQQALETSGEELSRTQVNAKFKRLREVALHQKSPTASWSSNRSGGAVQWVDPTTASITRYGNKKGDNKSKIIVDPNNLIEKPITRKSPSIKKGDIKNSPTILSPSSIPKINYDSQQTGMFGMPLKTRKQQQKDFTQQILKATKDKGGTINLDGVNWYEKIQDMLWDEAQAPKMDRTFQQRKGWWKDQITEKGKIGEVARKLSGTIYNKNTKEYEQSGINPMDILSEDDFEQYASDLFNYDSFKKQIGKKPKGSGVDKSKAVLQRSTYSGFIGEDGRYIPSGETVKVVSDSLGTKISKDAGFSEDTIKTITGAYANGGMGKKDLNNSTLNQLNQAAEILQKDTSEAAQKLLKQIENAIVEAINNTNEGDIQSIAQKQIFGEDFDKKLNSTTPVISNEETEYMEKAQYSKFHQGTLFDNLRKHQDIRPLDFVQAQDDTKTIGESTSERFNSKTLAKAEAKTKEEETQFDIEQKAKIQTLFSSLFDGSIKDNIKQVFATDGKQGVIDFITTLMGELKDLSRGAVQESEVGVTSIGGADNLGHNDNGDTVVSPYYDEDGNASIVDNTDEEGNTLKGLGEETKRTTSALENFRQGLIDNLLNNQQDAGSLQEKEAYGAAVRELELGRTNDAPKENKTVEQNYEESFNRLANFLNRATARDVGVQRYADASGMSFEQAMIQSFKKDDYDEQEKDMMSYVVSKEARTRFDEALGGDFKNIDKAIDAFFASRDTEIEEIYNQIKSFKSDPDKWGQFKSDFMGQMTVGGYNANTSGKGNGVFTAMPMPTEPIKGGASPKMAHLLGHGQGQYIMAAYGGKTVDDNIAIAEQRLAEKKSLLDIDDGKYKKSQENLEYIRNKYATKVTKSGERVSWKSGEDMGYSAQEIADDKKIWDKAKKVQSPDSLTKEIETITQDLNLMYEASNRQKLSNVTSSGRTSLNPRQESIPAIPDKNNLVDDINAQTDAVKENTNAVKENIQVKNNQNATEEAKLDIVPDIITETETTNVNTEAIQENTTAKQEKQIVENTDVNETPNIEKETQAITENTDAVNQQIETKDAINKETPSGEELFPSEEDLKNGERVFEENKSKRESKRKESSSSSSKTGSEYYESYGEETEAIKSEKLALKEISKLYANQLKNIQAISNAKEKQKSIDEILQQLSEQGITSENETYKILEEQRDSLQKQINLEENQYSDTQGRIDTVKNGINSSWGKSQVSDLERQQNINAQESVGAGVKTATVDKTKEELSKQNVAIKEYLSNLKQKYKYEQDSARLQKEMMSQTDIEKDSSQKILDALNTQIAGNQTVLNGYDAQTGKLNGIQLSKENQVKLDKQISELNGKQETQLTKISNQATKQKGLFEQIADGVKTSLRSLINYSLAYKAIGLIQQQFSNLINVTKQLDSELVDIQIATGNTREETHNLLKDYNDMADVLGRTTQEVASASDDWLRAGYQGKEAAELTKASMQLSTLGQIGASDATTYLISVLKGWRIEAEEVSNVVDKLSAVDMSAAISAGDLAEAMSRANNVARIGGSDMNRYIGYITTVADATQKSASSVGESFKTVYSRLGNVAAGKFVASIEEQQSSDYNEDEWSNLNDIETVLGTIGIKLRDTADTFRNIDDVMADIGEKWSGFNDVTQNAIATAVAGVRQRENVVTLFENWENVSKFEDIAANSYGTASEKMEAFSDSIEASQNRLTAAIEKWALFFKGESMIKDFYDALTFIISNLKTLGIAVTTLTVAMNGTNIIETGIKGFTHLEQKLINFSGIFERMSSNFSSVKGETGSFRNKMGVNLTEAYDAAIVSDLNKQLNGLSSSASDSTMMIARNSQQQLLNLSTEKQNYAIDLLQGKIDEDTYINSLYELEVEKNHLNLTKTQSEELKNSIRAQNAYTLSLINGKDANNQVAGKVAENVQKYQGRASAKDVAIQGGAMLGGMVLGGAGYGTLGKMIGGDSGQIVGTMLGGIIGSAAMKSISEAFLSGGGLKAALTVSGGIPLLGIGIAVAGLIWKGFNSYHQKKLEEAQESFKTLSEDFSAAQGANATVATYSKLVKGVDSLGRNVSLTDDEYQNFLDTSNSLAEIFPELVVKTDELGNSFVGINGKVSDVTNSVNTLTQALQNQADNALLEPELFKDNYNTAKANYEDAEKQLKELSNYQGQQKIWEDAGVRYTINTANGQKEYNKDDLINFGNHAVTLKKQELKKQMKDSINSMSDEAKAIIRQDSNIDYNNLSTEQQDFLNSIGSGIQFDGDSEQYKSNIESAIESAKKVLDDNPNYLSLVYNDQETAYETQKARMDFAQQLANCLPESMSDDDKKGILIKFGFEYDPKSNSIVDTEDYLTKLEKEFNVDADNNTGIGQSLKNASLERVKAMYNGLSNGTISTNSSLANVQRALSNSELKESDNQYDKEAYLDRSTEDMNKIIKKNNLGALMRQYVDIEDEQELNQKIEKDFGVLTDETHNALTNSISSFKKDLEEGKKGASEALTDAQADLATTLNTNVFSQSQELLKLNVADVFPSLELDDGLINTWGELADALQAVADGLDLVQEAETQWNKKGRISTKTILELLDSNANYADVLDTSGEKIKLKANAEELATQVQIQAIKASIDDTIATDQNTLATNEAEIASINEAIATANSANSMIDEIPILGKLAKQAGIATKAVAALAYVKTALANKSFNFSELKDIWNQDYNVKTDNNGGNYIDVQALEDRKKALEDSNQEIKKRDEILEKLKSGGIDLDEIDTDFGNDDSSDKDTDLDIAQAKLDLIDKEAEAIKALDRAKTLEGGRDTEYYNLERKALLNKKNALQAALKTDEKESERLGHLKDIQDVEVALRNLDDEELADKESWAETLGNSTDRMKQIYIAEIKSADTYEEKINAQKKLRDLQDQEYENQKKLNDSMIDSLKRQQEFMNPMDNDYSTQTDKMVEYYESTMTKAQDHMQQLLVRHMKERMKEYNSETGALYTKTEAEEWAKQQEDYIAVQEEYYSSVDAIAQLYLDKMDARVNEIQRKIDNLEKSKPNEWTNVSQITDYRDETVDYLNDQISEMKNFLATTDNLTTEQINDTVDKINEAILAVKQAQIDAQNDIKDHQDKIYDAITWQVNQYIKDINKYKDKIDKVYDDEIERLNEINNAHERTTKLIDLENKLADAGKEKKRVAFNMPSIKIAI